MQEIKDFSFFMIHKLLRNLRSCSVFDFEVVVCRLMKLLLMNLITNVSKMKILEITVGLSAV